MPFEIGDKVYISLPENWDEYPSWTNEMNEEIDLKEEYTISFVSDRVIALQELGWNFSPNWLSLSKSNAPKITGPYAHVIKKIKQLDKRFENRHKETEHDF